MEKTDVLIIGAGLAGTSRIQYPPNMRIIKMMCSSVVDPIYILHALLEGADSACAQYC
jgi:F420-non-reducing hydrogenase iron-sulfur subunit